MQAFAQEGLPLVETTPLKKMERLAQEIYEGEAPLSVTWQARGELRERSGADDDVWLHLEARTSVPLTCQRCMGAVSVPLDVDQWYRFVAGEDVAMAEDDASEEDLLVMEPQFDLLALLEDELLMALPLVPMHEQCPSIPAQPQNDGLEESPAVAEKPNPFAVLAKLKK